VIGTFWKYVPFSPAGFRPHSLNFAAAHSAAFS